MLLNVFGEESNIEEQAQSINCCDVCNMNAANGKEEILDVSTELVTLINASRGKR